LTIRRASRVLLASLILISSALAGSASAQGVTVYKDAILEKPADREKSPPTPKLILEGNPAKPTTPVAQDSVAPGSAIIPPAPNVVKIKENAILIPADSVSSEPKFEEQVASNVKVGSLYGYRRDPFTRRAKFHSGVDIKARWGDPVAASHAGTVQFAGWFSGYGNLVIVNHGGGVTTYYAHLSSFDVVVGDRVERGVIVGRAGSTGRATSPHLHYEVRLDGNPVNPFQPLALPPSSDYFKQTEASADAATGELTEATRPRRVN
jgi:murein DD-endopeptidase MepM/ murein hydrolase activator NlpD